MQFATLKMLRNSSNSQSNSNIEKSNTPSTSSTLANNVQNANQPVKKEKQKPESWNKIEQQIFFNALRQVTLIKKEMNINNFFNLFKN